MKRSTCFAAVLATFILAAPALLLLGAAARGQKQWVRGLTAVAAVTVAVAAVAAPTASAAKNAAEATSSDPYRSDDGY